TVNPKALTITADNQTKIYGSVFNFAGTEFTSNGLVNSDSISSVNLTSAGSPSTATVSGSPYSIVASAATGSGLSNYSITYVNGLLTVNPKALTITADNQSKIYGSVFNFGGTEFTSNGLVNSDSISSVNLTSAGTPATATVLGGPYSIVASAATGTGLSNYTISYVNGLLTVNQAPLSITASNQTKTYGQILPSTTNLFTSTPLQNGETIGTVDISSAGLSPTAGVASSPYAITSVSNAAGGTFNASNYAITYILTGSISVNPAALTITANNQVKLFGQTLPSTTSAFSSSGLQNGETIGTVDIVSAGLNGGAVLGSYPITSVSNPAGGTFNAANYNINYILGALIIVSEPIPSSPLSQLPNLLMLNYPDYYNHTFSNHADIIVIGRVLWLQGNVIVIGQDGSMRMLSLGDSVYLGDRVVAENAESQANIQVYTDDVVHVDANHPYGF
ncbi:MAG: MBG domain-containing protein, partial [Gammaproteobacteria bacterium]|nr:MBG domain-containing protein [Gammaproteobacteria bacterium]